MWVLSRRISHKITRALRWRYILGKREFHYIHVTGTLILVLNYIIKHYAVTAYGSEAEV
jgi:hypothetical protein